jgi:hypothetical protein
MVRWTCTDGVDTGGDGPGRDGPGAWKGAGGREEESERKRSWLTAMAIALEMGEEMGAGDDSSLSSRRQKRAN